MVRHAEILEIKQHSFGFIKIFAHFTGIRMDYYNRSHAIFLRSKTSKNSEIIRAQGHESRVFSPEILAIIGI